MEPQQKSAKMKKEGEKKRSRAAGVQRMESSILSRLLPSSAPLLPLWKTKGGYHTLREGVTSPEVNGSKKRSRDEAALQGGGAQCKKLKEGNRSPSCPASSSFSSANCGENDSLNADLG